MLCVVTYTYNKFEFILNTTKLVCGQPKFFLAYLADINVFMIMLIYGGSSTDSLKMYWKGMYDSRGW